MKISRVGTSVLLQSISWRMSQRPATATYAFSSSHMFTAGISGWDVPLFRIGKKDGKNYTNVQVHNVVLQLSEEKCTRRLHAFKIAIFRPGIAWRLLTDLNCATKRRAKQEKKEKEEYAIHYDNNGNLPSLKSRKAEST